MHEGISSIQRPRLTVRLEVPIIRDNVTNGVSMPSCVISECLPISQNISGRCDFYGLLLNRLNVRGYLATFYTALVPKTFSNSLRA